MATFGAVRQTPLNPVASRPEAADGRKKARKFYRYIAVLQFLLGVGLITSASLAVKYTAGSDGFGPPYFVGGFVVGALELGAAALSFYINKKSSRFDETDIIKREVACAVTGSQILGMLTFMGCFMGLVLDGIGGLCSRAFCYYEYYEEQNHTLAVTILVLLLVSIVTVVGTICLSCAYGPYFGVIASRRRGPVLVIANQGGTNTVMNTSEFGAFGQTQPQQFAGMNPAGTGGLTMEQLQQQNQLLQQQIHLQQQLLQQQQQQPQQQQYPAAPGFYTAPPSYGDVVATNTVPSAPNYNPDKS